MEWLNLLKNQVAGLDTVIRRTPNFNSEFLTIKLPPVLTTEQFYENKILHQRIHSSYLLENLQKQSIRVRFFW